LPSQHINLKELKLPQNTPLADLIFFKQVDIVNLIGVEIYNKIVCVGQINIKNHDAVLLKTKFGWIIGGKICNQVN
jgi:hypothetical protein